MTRYALALFVLAACHPSAGPAPGSRRTPKQGSSTPVAVASVAPASAASAAIVVAPSPPPADATADDLEAIALRMCAAAFRMDNGRRVVGCRRPPPFEGKGRAPDGKVVEHTGEDLAPFCGISLGARGSFTAPDKKETLITIDNCRDDDRDEGWNGSLPGSAAIVAQEDGRWVAVAATRGVDTGDCRVIRRKDGRDTLMCRSRYDAYAIGTAHYFFHLDFAGGKPVARTVAHFFDDAENFACGVHDKQSSLADAGVTSVHIVNVSTSDTNGDGTPDLLIDVERAHAAPSPKLAARLRALCKQGKSIGEALPAPTRTRIEIVSDAAKFRATPASKKLLDDWGAASGDITQLEGAAPPKVDH